MSKLTVGDEIQIGGPKGSMAVVTVVDPLTYQMSTGPNKGTTIHAGAMVNGLRALGIPQSAP